jgi:LysM repeat protein
MAGAASSSGGEYTVAEGDTLSSIARTHGVNSRDLANWNNIRNPNLIQQGQSLRLSAP